MAQQIRPLIGLTSRQITAVENYRREAGDKAALRYASHQHRFRAETIVNTELAFAYNQGAHIGVTRSIAQGYMSRCEMVWSTAGTNRVCGRCLELKDKVVGYTDEQVQLPPLHPRCRCAIIYREVPFKFDIQRFGGQPLPAGNYNLTVRRQVQNRHIEGTSEHNTYIEQNRKKGKSFLPSVLAPNVNAQDLVNEFHGKGIYAPHSDAKQLRERVDTGRVIGQYWDYAENKLIDTTWLMIVYSNKGTHVYPCEEV